MYACSVVRRHERLCNQEQQEQERGGCLVIEPKIHLEEDTFEACVGRAWSVKTFTDGETGEVHYCVVTQRTTVGRIRKATQEDGINT